MFGLIKESILCASQASKAADLALLSSIERRIDAEFKGGADQLLQLQSRSAMLTGSAAARSGPSCLPPGIVEAETSLPANDVGLLKARVARAGFATADDEALDP